MKALRMVLMPALLLFAFQVSAQYPYVSPRPGSVMQPVTKHIILKPGELVDAASLQKEKFSISGSKSGTHDFRVVLSSDGKTILLYPLNPYAYEEEITVTVHPGVHTLTGKMLEGRTFSFHTRRYYTPEEEAAMRQAARQARLQEQAYYREYYRQQEQHIADSRGDVTGQFVIKVNTNPSEGVFMYDAWSAGILGNSKWDGFYIISNNGDSLYGSEKLGGAFDFSLNPNGYLSHYNEKVALWEVRDSNMNVIDGYTPGNGYNFDAHEFTIYPNGHAWMVVAEDNIVDLSVYDPSYPDDAIVMTTLVQEFDADKNVIWEWRGFDHIIPTETNQNLDANYVDVIHTNSIELTPDGDVLCSHRHLNQVTLIDYETGEFIWRLGGVNNQFTFINGSETFNFQHDARILPNGHITLWDNGNAHFPARSRAKEYRLNLDSMTAELVWYYQPKTYNNNNAFWFAMGSTQRLDNGNTVINGGWDYSSNQSNFYEVTPAGVVVWELALQNSKSLVSYRCRKFQWKPCAPVAIGSVSVTEITDSTALISWVPVANAVSYTVSYREAGATTWNTLTATATSVLLQGLLAKTDYEFTVMASCANNYSSDECPVQTFTTTGDIATGLAAADALLRVFPNPASETVVLRFPVNSDWRVVVYDAPGRVVKSAFHKQTEEVRLDLGGLSAGMYRIEALGSRLLHTTVVKN
ncbi:MAG: arylsulfotransferase family protein [Chitinophagales bacterium]|nr:aryl-sulfate sulfotransferase [Chitinophagales bacterium]MDW8392921.1 arylsulfotransferase family protein [Chitinophagales bacterium]